MWVTSYLWRHDLRLRYRSTLRFWWADDGFALTNKASKTWSNKCKQLICWSCSDLEFVWAEFPRATSKRVESSPRTISNPEMKFCCRPTKDVQVWEIWRCHTGYRWSDWNSDPECGVLDWLDCERCLSWTMKFRYPEKIILLRTIL